MPYSVCEDFITKDTELVSAWRIMQTLKKSNQTSVYRHYLNCCSELGISEMVCAMDQMIVLDYIIANEDRHQNNFGLVRDANTLKWIGVAPIFDSGSSLGYDKLPGQILSGRNIECKPFKRSHEEQLRLVSSFEWIDFEQLEDLDIVITDIFRQAGDYMDESRVKAIVMSVKERIKHLHQLASVGYVREDSVYGDVVKDVARTYGYQET